MSKKQFVALARVSSREQEREGFSLDVQEEGLRRFAKQQEGEIVQFYRIAETASKSDERKTFQELLAYAKENAKKLDGILFYKVDRAARNLFDYVELERIEFDYNLPFIAVSQPTERSPAGRMQRRVLASMASFYTEQLSVDVREGLARRVQNGLFPGKTPYGYQNVKIAGRSLVEVDPVKGPNVRSIFELFAYNALTLDSLSDRLVKEGIWYKEERQQFVRSRLHAVLRDRAYLGEVRYKDDWHPGTHEPLVDKATFHRVQVLLGEKVYRNRELTYAGMLIRCGHCKKPITGELKVKKTKSGKKEYAYYRCARYNVPGHPRVRVTETDLDRDVLAMFSAIRIEDPRKREWFKRFLRERSRHEQRESTQKVSDINRRLTRFRNQQDELLNLRLHEEIDSETFTRKSAELRDQEDGLRLRLEAASRGRHEQADLTIKVFELSQSLCSKWDTADYVAKRRILEIVCLNFTLEGATLVPQMRKPFAILAEGQAVPQSWGTRI